MGESWAATDRRALTGAVAPPLGSRHLTRRGLRRSGGAQIKARPQSARVITKTPQRQVLREGANRNECQPNTSPAYESIRRVRDHSGRVGVGIGDATEDLVKRGCVVGLVPTRLVVEAIALVPSGAPATVVSRVLAMSTGILRHSGSPNLEPREGTELQQARNRQRHDGMSRVHRLRVGEGLPVPQPRPGLGACVGRRRLSRRPR